MDKDINMLLMVLMKVPCEITDDNEDCNVLEKKDIGNDGAKTWLNYYISS